VAISGPDEECLTERPSIGLGERDPRAGLGLDPLAATEYQRGRPAVVGDVRVAVGVDVVLVGRAESTTASTSP
jgi:hypothetical protein